MTENENCFSGLSYREKRVKKMLEGRGFSWKENTKAFLVKRTRGGLKMDSLGNFGRCVQCVPLYRDLIGVSAEAMLHRLAWPHKYRIIFNFVCKLKLPRELINARRAGSDPGSSAMLGLEQAFCCSSPCGQRPRNHWS